jgi:tetratricopeptide (TPR) repeat protein
MPIDPDGITGAGARPDPTIAPFTADRTPVPETETTTSFDTNQTSTQVTTDDPDRTVGLSQATDPLQTIADADPEQTIAGPDVLLGPGAELLPGTRLGSRYTVIRLLGRGGMGAVYQAYDDELGVAVAIKTILPGHADEYTRRDQVSRFKSELLLARQVTHKNVVRIHDLGEVGGLKYITMSYIEGETLAALIKRLSRVPVAQALSLARQIADGMGAAHEAGVVHRDLKPENVIVNRDGQALIMDFGIASSSAGATSGGPMTGTIAYMAPEQATGKPVDARADIYAFGLIVYDMLVGRQRLKAHASPMDEMRARFVTPPTAARQIREDVPEAFDALVTKAVQPDPEARFADSVALGAAFDALDDDGNLKPIEKPRARWPAVTAAMLVTALLVTGVWRWISPPPVAAKPPVSVLIADFQNRTGDPVFNGVVEQALALGVEEASFITAYPRRDALRVAAALRPGAPLDEQTARLVALREGVAVIVLGEVVAENGRYRISARALRGSDDKAEQLNALSVEADNKDGVLQAVGVLAGEVREALGDTSASSDATTAAETFSAGSLEAARAYTSAQEAQWSGKVDDAITEYKKALELDPEMGRAYAGLAAQYANLGRTADAESNYQGALARLDRMTDREKFRTRGSYYLFARKPDLAVQEFTALVKAFPADSTGLTNLSLASFYQRDMTQALEQGRRAAAIFPKNVLRRANVALYAMYAGKFEEAIKEADAVHQLNPTHLKAFVARALSLLALERIPEATATYDQLAAISAAGDSFATAGRADLAQYQGRYADAVRLLDAGIAADVERKNAAGAASKRIALAEAHLAKGDQAAAVRDAQAAASGSESDAVRTGAALVLAAAGQSAQAESLAVALNNKLEADPQAYGRLVQAEIALARKDPRKAVELAREAQKYADTWLGQLTLGRAYLGLTAYPEAYSALEAALKRRGEATAVFLDDVPTYRRVPPVYYYMGLAQKGLRSSAAPQSFQHYLDIMGSGERTAVLDDARRRAAEK